MPRRALAIALILLLLLTQQLGLGHWASHGLAAAAPASAGPVVTGADAGPVAAKPAPLDNSPADAPCQVCGLLAALALAALPALLLWRGLALGCMAPAAQAVRRCCTAASRPYQARAPPR